MLRLLISPILFFSLAIAQAPGDLKQVFHKMMTAMDNLEFETMVDYTYPKLVSLAGRDSLLKEMRQPFEDPALKLIFLPDQAAPQFSEIQQIDTQKFCIIRRQTALKIVFTEKLPDDAAAEILANMQRSAPARKVHFVKKENAFYSTGPELILAIAEELTRMQWRFLTYEPAQRPLLKQFFGEKALQKLGL